MNRFNGSAPVAPVLDIDDLDLYSWFERDRQSIELRRKDNDETVIEFWDEDVTQLVEDGFINPRNLKQSLYDYAKDIGYIA